MCRPSGWACRQLRRLLPQTRPSCIRNHQNIQFWMTARSLFSHLEPELSVKGHYLAGGTTRSGQYLTSDAYITKKRPAFADLLCAGSLTIIEVYPTISRSSQTSFIGTNRCSTVSLLLRKVYDRTEINWSRIIQVVFRPISRTERPQRALRWGYFLLPSPLIFKDNRCYPNGNTLRTP